jgi:hypothetical protein
MGLFPVFPRTPTPLRPEFSHDRGREAPEDRYEGARNRGAADYGTVNALTRNAAGRIELAPNTPGVADFEAALKSRGGDFESAIGEGSAVVGDRDVAGPGATRAPEPKRLSKQDELSPNFGDGWKDQAAAWA